MSQSRSRFLTTESPLRKDRPVASNAGLRLQKPSSLTLGVIGNAAA